MGPPPVREMAGETIRTITVADAPKGPFVEILALLHRNGGPLTVQRSDSSTIRTAHDEAAESEHLSYRGWFPNDYC